MYNAALGVLAGQAGSRPDSANTNNAASTNNKSSARTSMTASQANALNSATKGKKKTKQEIEEEERLLREQQEALAAIPPPTPFDSLAAIWQETDLHKQRQLISSIFSCADGPGLSIESLRVDELYSHLKFAHDSGLNSEQTKVFMSLISDIQSSFQSITTVPEFLQSHDTLLEKVFGQFKKNLLSFANVSKDGKQVIDPATTSSPLVARSNADGATVSTTSSSSVARPDTAGDRRPTTSNASAKTPSAASAAKTPRSDANSAPGEHTTDILEVATNTTTSTTTSSNSNNTAPLPSKYFSLPQIKVVTDYVVNTIFANFRLYQAVYNEKLFLPQRSQHVEHLHLETVIPFVTSTSSSFNQAYNATAAAQGSYHVNLNDAVELHDTTTRTQLAAKAELERLERYRQEEEVLAALTHRENQVLEAQQRAVSASSASPPGTASTSSGTLHGPLTNMTSSSWLDAEFDDQVQDELTLLVRKHARQAKLDMSVQLQQHQHMLETRLKVLEANLPTVTTTSAANNSNNSNTLNNLHSTSSPLQSRSSMSNKRRG